MPFTDKDREKLVETHTTVNFMKKEYDRRLGDLEQEDNVLHGRINRISRGFTTAIVGINAIWGSVLGYLKMRG